MSRLLTSIIKDLRRKVLTLAAEREQSAARLEELERENESLKEQLAECRNDLQTAKMEVDFLTISHRLADSPENLISARRRVQRLIAKIDRCVSLLKEDAEIS